MYLNDLISSSFKSLFRRKLRTILTILGVTIGTVAIVLMLSIGFGLEETYKRQLEHMGSLTLIEVYVPYGGGGMVMSRKIGGPSKDDGQKKLDDDAIAEMAYIENVEAVIPLLRTNLKMAAGRYTSYVNLIGINPENMKYLGLTVGQGELLNSESTYDIVFGNEVLYQFRKPGRNGGGISYYGDFYGGEEGERKPPEVDVFNMPLIMTYNMQYGEPNPDGNPPAINYRNYKINAAGVLKTEGYSEYSYSAFMNMDQLKKVITEYEKASKQKILENGYSNVKVKVNDIKNVKSVQDQLKRLGYEAYSLTDQLDSMNEMTKIIQLVLGGIAGVAFLIAAIGIANTMVMSIYERTKEIGVIKVLGCVVSTIRKMFLFEAALIGLVGGLVGTGFSIVLSKVANTLIGGAGLLGMAPNEETVISLITPELAIGAIVFSTLVGVIFGLYPAFRATRISPLEAIRHD